MTTKNFIGHDLGNVLKKNSTSIEVKITIKTLRHSPSPVRWHLGHKIGSNIFYTSAHLVSCSFNWCHTWQVDALSIWKKGSEKFFENFSRIFDSFFQKLSFSCHMKIYDLWKKLCYIVILFFKCLMCPLVRYDTN